MSSIVISIGSNAPERDRRVAECIDFLKSRFKSTRFSDVYNTPAANGRDADYLNAVMEGSCTDCFDTTKALLKSYETEQGRTPESKTSGVIPIDIDIVMWDGAVIRQRDFSQKYFQIGWKQLHQ